MQNSHQAVRVHQKSDLYQCHISTRGAGKIHTRLSGLSRMRQERPKRPRNTSSACCSPGSLAMVSSTYAFTFCASSGRCPKTNSSSRQSYSCAWRRGRGGVSLLRCYKAAIMLYISNIGISGVPLGIQVSASGLHRTWTSPSSGGYWVQGNTLRCTL